MQHFIPSSTVLVVERFHCSCHVAYPTVSSVRLSCAGCELCVRVGVANGSGDGEVICSQCLSKEDCFFCCHC